MAIQTTVTEFYLFVGASTRAWGTTHNPWNLEYSPGGSSAGSGPALTAGFATLALGSDMGGSIRLPASQNGLYGFRSPLGRVASSEVPMSTSGPMARRFDDLVHLQNAIVGPSDKIMAGSGRRSTIPPHTRMFQDGASPYTGVPASPPSRRRRRVRCKVPSKPCAPPVARSMKSTAASRRP